MDRLPKQCLHCGGTELFTRRVCANGSDGPHLLNGLGAFLRPAEFDVVLCTDCGRCEFFADGESRRKALTSDKWRRAGDAG